MPEVPVDEDPNFDAEVEALLRPGNPELLRGVRRETLALMGLEAPPRRTPRYLWYGAPVAIAATVVFFVVSGPKVLTPGDLGSSAGLEVKFSRQIQLSRGTSAESGVPTYGAESVLQIDVKADAKLRDVAEELEVFEVDAERKLRRLVMETDRSAPYGKAVSFQAKAKISEIFDLRSSGKKMLVLIVGRYSSDLPALDGAPLSEVESRADLRCVRREIAITSSLSSTD